MAFTKAILTHPVGVVLMHREEVYIILSQQLQDCFPITGTCKSEI
jgi:hypothetical protein